MIYLLYYLIPYFIIYLHYLLFIYFIYYLFALYIIDLFNPIDLFTYLSLAKQGHPRRLT